MRDLAEEAGITERSALMIIADLESGGYVHRERDGRRNVYEVAAERPFRHTAESGHTVGELIEVFREHEVTGRRGESAQD